eukprot:Hpha_TRINITY_DN9351_c0_g1::TRINITY_DN9351_c0_g1_i2::g.25884::m.25884
MRRALLLFAGVASVGAQSLCMPKSECETQLQTRISDVRTRIVDTVQSELDGLLQIAPTAIMKDDVKYEEGLFDFDLSTANNRSALAQMLYYQLQGLPEVYWIYYGEQSTGRFLGFRRATTTEVNTVTGVTANMLIRTECAGTGSPMSFYKTDTTDSSGGDAIGSAFNSVTWDLASKAWFTQGIAISNQADQFSITNGAVQWTSTYAFSDGTLGVSAVRRVETRPSATGSAIGVVAADYSLSGLSDFIKALPIPPLPSGDPMPVLILEGPSKKILATNIAGLEGQTATSSTNALVAQAADKMYTTQAGYLGTSSSVWATLQASATQATFNYGNQSSALTAVGLESPAGGTNPLRLVSLMVSDVDMGYVVIDPTCTSPNVGTVACRETLLSAALDLRFRTLSFLAQNTKEYLGVAYVVVNSLDETYNLGDFNVGWCDPCGSFDLTNAGERANIDLHLKNLLVIYRELYWVYYGQNSNRQYLGYLRPLPTTYQRWECNGGMDSQTCGTAKFTWINNNSVARTDPNDPLTRPWYTSGYALAYDKFYWTVPYTFGNGEVGLSIVKKAFGGDWDRTTGKGVWAADFSLGFIATYVNSLSVDEGWVVYIVAKDGLLLGSTATGETVGSQANTANNVVIRGTAPELLQLSSAGLWDSTERTTSYTDPSGRFYFVDYVGVKDTSTDVVRSYDWAFVLCAPEDVLYDVNIGSLSSGSGRTQILFSLLLAAVAAIAAFVH